MTAGREKGMIRAFLALALSEEMRAEIDDRLAPLRRKRLPVRWVPPENLHVTLRFLGDVTRDLRAEVEGAVEAAVAGNEPFPAALGSPGAFPRIDRARVLWVGLSEGDAAVRALARQVDSALRPLDFAPEKRFHPHITVGRVKAPLHRDAADRFSALEIVPHRTMVTSVDMMRSTLTPEGAVYEIIRKIPLR